MDCVIAFSVAYFVVVLGDREIPMVQPHYEKTPKAICEMHRLDPRYKKGWHHAIAKLQPMTLRTTTCVPCTMPQATREGIVEINDWIAAKRAKTLRRKFAVKLLDTPYPYSNLPRWRGMDKLATDYGEIIMEDMIRDYFRRVLSSKETAKNP